MSVSCFNKFSNLSNGTMFGPSDGPNMVPLNKLESLLSQIIEIDKLVKNF